MSWVVSVEDVSVVESRLGRQAQPGRRVRPDGHELAWKQIGVLDVIEDPQLPFFVEWVSPETDHPSRGASGVSIAKVEICGDPNAVYSYLGSHTDIPLEGVAVEWVESDEPGLVAVCFSTPHGDVRID